MEQMKNFGATVLLLLAVSCTIIKDTDVTSLEQYNSLKLYSIEMDQDIQSGGFSETITLIYDSVVDRISGTGAHVSRVQAFTIPTLGNHKLRFRSGNHGESQMAIGYKDNGLPNAITITTTAGDTLVEFYRFFYNSSNQLSKFTTQLVFGPGDTLRTNDSIFYETNGALLRFQRRPPAWPSAPLSLSALQPQSNGSGHYLRGWTSWSGSIYNLNSYSCDNNGDDPTLCGELSISGNTNYDVATQTAMTLGKMTQTSLTDVRFDQGGGGCPGCGREMDTYYFHPMLLLRNLIPDGGQFMLIYAIDWWKPGTASVSNQSLSKNDVVTFKFNYVK